MLYTGIKETYLDASLLVVVVVVAEGVAMVCFGNVVVVDNSVTVMVTAGRMGLVSPLSIAVVVAIVSVMGVTKLMLLVLISSLNCAVVITKNKALMMNKMILFIVRVFFWMQNYEKSDSTPHPHVFICDWCGITFRHSCCIMIQYSIAYATVVVLLAAIVVVV